MTPQSSKTSENESIQQIICLLTFSPVLIGLKMKNIVATQHKMILESN